jgi:hypothetical protein
MNVCCPGWIGTIQPEQPTNFHLTKKAQLTSFLLQQNKKQTTILQLIISDGLHYGHILFARRTKGNCVEIRIENILKLSRAIKAVFLTSSWQSFLLLAPSKKKLHKFGVSEGKVVFVHATTAEVGLEF